MILLVEHRVRDFASWKRAFDGDPVGREEGGVRGYRVSRLAADPNHVVVELDFDDAERAEAFAQRLRALWASAGPRLGLETPTARVLEVIETRAP